MVLSPAKAQLSLGVDPVRSASCADPENAISGGSPDFFSHQRI